MNRVAIFIDGPGHYHACLAIPMQTDYGRICTWAGSEFGDVVRAKYYALVDEEKEVQTLRPRLDWLSYNGWLVHEKPLVRREEPGGGSGRVVSTINVELAVDMIEAAGYADELVLFSGNAELCAAVDAVQRRGPRVTVVSSLDTTADLLRRQADRFIDMASVQHAIARIGGAQPAARPGAVTPMASARR